MNYMKVKNKVTKMVDEDRSEKCSQLGAIVKKIRLKENLTQESLSYGVCSISYLSKVENNKMRPNMYFINEVGTRLNINLMNYYTHKGENRFLKEIIRHVYYQDSDALKTLKASIKPLKDTPLYAMIDLSIHTLDKAYHHANRLIESLEPLIATMNVATCQLYLILSAMVSYEQKNYVNTLRLLTLSNELDASNPQLKALEQTYLYLSKQMLELKTSSLTHYQKAMQYYTEFPNDTRLMHLKLHTIYFMHLEAPEHAAEQIGKIPESQIDASLRNLYLYLCLIHLNDETIKDTKTTYYQQMIEDTNDRWYFKLLNLQYDHYAFDSALRNDIATIFMNTRFNEATQLEQVAFHAKTIHQSDSKKKHLKDIALPLAIKQAAVPEIKTYTESLIEIAADNARYKEAISYYRKKQKALKKIIRPII